MNSCFLCTTNFSTLFVRGPHKCCKTQNPFEDGTGAPSLQTSTVHIFTFTTNCCGKHFLVQTKEEPKKDVAHYPGFKERLPTGRQYCRENTKMVLEPLCHEYDKY